MIDPNFKSVLLISFAYITSIHVGDFLGTHSEHVEIHMYDCDFNYGSCNIGFSGSMASNCGLPQSSQEQ